MLPTSIQILHELENHEHTICSAIGEYHIHKKEFDCDEFHKQLTSFSVDFISNYDVIPQHFYTSIFIDNSQKFKDTYQSNTSSRGPPNFTV